MSVSNVIYELTSFSPTGPTLPQFREPQQENHFDGQSIIIQDSHKSLVRASTFIKYFTRTLNTPKGSKSPLQALLERLVHLPATEENKPPFSEITEAFFKQKSYLLRLFSNESWEEWFENRTALGKIASLFRNCIESRAEVCSFMKAMNPQLIQKANEEATVLLKRLSSREVTRTSKSSCLLGVTSGIAASFLLENPLPLLMGLSECFSRAYAQQKVGNEFQVNTYITINQRYPSVTSFSNGNFVVTWESEDQDGSEYGVYGQLFNGSSSKIGSEFRANTYTTNLQWRTSVTSLADGNFVVTWESWFQDGSTVGVYGQLFDGNGSTIGSEFRANAFTIDAQHPSVASFSNGNFVVTWEGQDGSNRGVYGQLFNRNGTKIGSEFQVNTYINKAQSDPSVASFTNGNFVVTWYSLDQDGSMFGVYGQLFDGNGVKIGSEFRANTYTNNQQWFPSVASFSDGNFVVTWRSDGQDGSQSGIYGQLFDGNGSKIRNEFRANSYTTDYQQNPSVASLPNGNFVVTWDSKGQDGPGYGVYGQLFNGNASKIGNEFQVNTYTDDNQQFPSVASFSNGNFVVAWTSSNDQDGLWAGVFGQIFHDNITYRSSSTTTSSSTSSTTTSTTSSFTTSTTSSTTSSISSSSEKRNEMSSSLPPSNKRLLWLWLLLGIGGGTTCLGVTGYLLIKFRDDDEEGVEHVSELGKMQTGPSTETHYQRTPDHVTQEEIHYQLTPSHVTQEGPQYQHTPDHEEEMHYQLTPSHVTQENHSDRC